MKHLKTYEENEILYKPKFKVGDIVYVSTDRETAVLKKNKPYKIKNIERKELSNLPHFYYELIKLSDHIYSEDRFMSELDYEAYKFNL